MRIEDNIGIFTISEIDDDINETYIGEFKVKLTLSPLDLLAIDRDYRELIGAVNPIMASDDASNIAFALSQLRHRVISSPSFWRSSSNYGGGHLNKKILYRVLDSAIECQESFKAQRKEEMEKIQARLVEQIKNNTIKKKVEEETELSENEE